LKGRKIKSIWAFLASVGSSTVLQLVGLVITPFYLELTSQELFGLWLTLGSLVGWISLGDLGIGMALTRRAVSAIDKSDYLELKKLTYGAMLSFIVIGFFFFICGIYLTDTLVSLFTISQSLAADFRATYFILLIVILIGQPLGVFDSIIEAKQHIAFQKINNTIFAFLAIIINILLLYVGYGIISFSISILITTLIKPIVSIYYLKRIDKKIEFYPFSTSMRQIKELFKFGGLFQILKIANLISTSTDNIVIASILGASFVSIYVFTSKIAFIIAVGLISIIPIILFPGMSQLFDIGDIFKIRNIYFGLVKIAIRLGISVGIFYYTVNETFIHLWVGDSNFGGNMLTFVFVIWIIIESFLRGITSILYASTKIRGLSIISIIESVLNLAISLFLVKYYGLVGVALGTVFSRLITLIYVPLKINKLLKVNSIYFLNKIVGQTIINCIPTILILLTADFFLIANLTSIWFILIMGVLTFFINILLFEGIFIFKQKNKSFKKRILMLKSYYT